MRRCACSLAGVCIRHVALQYAFASKPGTSTRKGDFSRGSGAQSGPVKKLTASALQQLEPPKRSIALAAFEAREGPECPSSSKLAPPYWGQVCRAPAALGTLKGLPNLESGALAEVLATSDREAVDAWCLNAW